MRYVILHPLTALRSPPPYKQGESTIRNIINTYNLKTSDMSTPQNGYPVQQYNGPVKRYCQTLDLRDNPELIAEYRKRHSKEHAWKEIIAGIREVGILEMEIYILGTRLFMIVETPLDFDWDTAMTRLSTLPRQAEWEDYMAEFQLVKEGLSSAEKWQLMERMFHLY